MLTTREYQIVGKLLNTRNAVRIKDVSEEFCVSDRTIKNDLENVKNWFKEKGVAFHAQPNKGIWIECLDGERLQLHNRMAHIGKSELYPDQNIRIKRIIGYLLIQSDYVTAQLLADYLEVSRNTIINDLNKVEAYIEPWLVHLERKQRLGYRLVGEEKHLRFLYEHIIREDLSHYDLYQIIKSIVNEGECSDAEPALTEAWSWSYKLALKHIRKQLKGTSENHYKQSEFITILIKLTVSLTRMNLGFSLGNYRLVNRDMHKWQQRDFLLEIAENAFAEAVLPLLECEFKYISQWIFEEIKPIDIAFVTKQIIRHVSEKEQVDYESDSKLYSDVLAHLSLRLQGGMRHRVEINPFAEEINQNHASLVQAIKEVCQFYIGYYVTSAQQSFTTFIALHFLISYQKKLGDQKKKAKTLYVCATGHGVARLIKNKVEQEISGINIFAYCSIMEVNEICQKEKIDLIISVFPIEADVPVIVVNPLPTKSDLKAIKKEVETIVSSEYRQLNDLLTSRSNDEESQDSETISYDIIIKGYEIYQEVIFKFVNGTDEQNKRNALMMHIFLMVHRYYFDKQYDYFAYADGNSGEKDERIKGKLQVIMERNNLKLNDAELIALLQYFK
ncbi:BglG family transcription antiterminator [Neobacillus sp. KR4-4]|uniref:BglG family transcription antiterminator n=1 Tax=Neobacillus sp. KR4-4 TaxID=3344872 RepID=UPI0035C997F6